MVGCTRGLGLCLAASLLLVTGTNVWVRMDVGGRGHATLESLPARAVAIVPGAPTSNKLAKASLEGRLKGALALYRSGRARAILVSGIDIERDPETTAMRTWLEDRGVPSDQILSDDGGSRTRATMYRAMRYFAVDNAIICTEKMHMPRALFLAKQNGIDAVGFELPSTLSRVPRKVAVEALKTTLAVLEETFAPAERPTSMMARTSMR